MRDRTINIQLLKAVVIVMGVMIVAGVAVIAVTIVNRVQSMAADQVNAATALGFFGRVDLAVPAGARIDDLLAAGDRLMVVLHTPDGPRILVVDLATGRALGEIRLQTAP